MYVRCIYMHIQTTSMCMWAPMQIQLEYRPVKPLDINRFFCLFVSLFSAEERHGKILKLALPVGLAGARISNQGF